MAAQPRIDDVFRSEKSDEFRRAASENVPPVPMREGVADYEAAKAEYCRLGDQIFDRTLQEQAHLFSEVKSNIEYYQQLCSRTEDLRRTFIRDAAEIQDACNIVLKGYRQTNLRVRVSAKEKRRAAGVIADGREQRDRRVDREGGDLR